MKDPIVLRRWGSKLNININHQPVRDYVCSATCSSSITSLLKMSLVTFALHFSHILMSVILYDMENFAYHFSISNLTLKSLVGGLKISLSLSTIANILYPRNLKSSSGAVKSDPAYIPHQVKQ